MILKTRTGNHEVRSATMFAGSDVIPRPTDRIGGNWTYAGKRVGFSESIALPAVLAAIRLLAETAASLPLLVYQDDGEDRDRANDAWQYELLHNRPNEYMTTFDLVAWIVASLQRGNAYLQKLKANGRVEALYPLDPEIVEPKVDGTSITYKIRPPGNARPVTLTRQDLIHIPGILMDSPFIGMSPIQANVNAIGTALAADEYAGRYFGNDATPGGVITSPGNLRKEQREEIRSGWEARHSGGAGSHRLGILWGGATYTSVGVSARDAEMVDARRYGVEDIARIFRVPAILIGGPETQPRITAEQRNMEYLVFSLGPWLARVEQALHNDDDLFPDKTLFPEFLADGLLRADTATRYAAYLQGRQAGWLSVNDIRERENMPPIPDGDLYQQTPVGGAPNLQPTVDPNADLGTGPVRALANGSTR